MKNNTKLRILLDTPSLKSNDAKRLMSYSDDDLLDFISIGKSLKHTELIIKKNDRGHIVTLVIDKSSSKINPTEPCYGFGYLHRDIQALSKGLNIKKDDLLRLFFLSTLTNNDQQCILVTERKKLINRKWWERTFSNISKYAVLSPDEASIYIDLFCKKNKKHMIAPNFFTNESSWYLYSMKNKVNCFQLPWSTVVFAHKVEISNKKELMEMLEALSDRLVDILVAIDEMGQQYYVKPNNDNQSKIVYHFNYWLTLYVGIIDNLALITQLRYQIVFEEKEKVGLSRKKNKEFLEDVSEHNQKIINLIKENLVIVDMVSNPRNIVIHRERLKSVLVDNRNEGFLLNMFRISEKFFTRIVTISKKNGLKKNAWGHYKSGDDCFLEPYQFSREATVKLIDFVNQYLKVLNFEEYQELYPNIKKRIEENHLKKSHEDYKNSLSIFNKHNLGY